MRFDQCTTNCTTDCGHCKGRPVEALRAEVERLRALLERAETVAGQLRWYQRRVAALGLLVGPMHAPSQPLRRELEATAARINRDGTWREVTGG